MRTINFIGAGRLGKTLAKLFRTQLPHAVKITGIINSTLASSLAAAQFAGENAAVKSLQDLPPADITFITANDDNIAEICAQLVTLQVLKPFSIVVHCSGALSSDVLLAAKSVSCSLASIHPGASFANPERAVESFPNTICSFEGDEAARITLTELFAALGAHVLTIKKADKKRYHAAAVLANNYLVTLHHQAVQNFMRAGIAESFALQLVTRLMSDAFTNLQHSSHVTALTGPIQRGDVATIQEHLDVLQNDGVARNIYASLGSGTLALTSHTPDLLRKLKKMLHQFLPPLEEGTK